MKSILQLVLTLLFQGLCCAQSTVIHLHVVNGKTGRAVPRQRILLFGSSSQAERMKESFEATTDAQGTATIQVNPDVTRWLQAFPDFMTGCNPHPNFIFYSVQEIISKGLSSPNTCGKSVNRPLVPGTFTFFIRKPTLREQWNW